MSKVLADSGFLVALGIERDPRHRAAREFLDSYRGALLVPAPAISESCYFLSTAGKVRLLQWVRKTPRRVLEVPAYAYPEVGEILARYADLDPDFTDAAIVWLAEATGCRSILTVDVRDFSTFRLKRGRRFELVKWFEP
ncbi:MAG: PIN domain-containing protein [Betaproteobacteria bacterium]|nr:PIN domain-containing protein [Betaproteobacteria bacterium]